MIVRGMKPYLPIVAFFISICVFNIHCMNPGSKPDPRELALARKEYAGLSDSASYVGMETCKGCHTGIHETFSHTGMGLSFEHASRQKSAGLFGRNVQVRDSYRSLNYHPFWENDSLYFMEFRMDGADTVYKRIEKISYIVGSGQHTNSHIWASNGYLFQAPMTFYTQDRKWDLPPGFEDGNNTRFSRKIGLECMTCHNGYPGFVQGSENKYSFVRNGIDCERCHGPGSIHVKEKSSGILIDTSTAIDYSIVNPAKLPIDRQLDVCQRCHIQGNAVLNEGKSFFDFKPGMSLKEVMHVFMPVYEGAGDNHIMASHAERLKQSRCYTESLKAVANDKSLKPFKNALTCVTCHNPHVSVKVSGKDHFNTACRNCHQAAKSGECTAPLAEQKKRGMNCSGCHMPLNTTTDIPHVRVHDHRIAVPHKMSPAGNTTKILKAINCIHEASPPDLVLAQAFINYVEKFNMSPVLLDSALKYIDRESDKLLTAPYRIHVLFLRKQFNEIVALVAGEKGLKEKVNRPSFDNRDAWTAYRIGEAYVAAGILHEAISWYAKAVNLAPYHAEFCNKYGSTLATSGKVPDAYKVFSELIREHPEYAPGYANLGYLLLVRDRNVSRAGELIRRALSLDPDYEMGWLNLAAVEMAGGDRASAIKAIEKVLSINPGNTQAREGLRRLKAKS